MRNWSSFLYNVTVEFNKKDTEASFGISKMLYSDERSEGSKAINKGIYLCIASTIGSNEDNKAEKIEEAIAVIKTFTDKEFMKLLIEEDNFYDIPAYSSLLQEGMKMKIKIKNKK